MQEMRHARAIGVFLISRPRITRHEIYADAVFLLVSVLVSLICLFIFDIHHSFYAGRTAFPPDEYIFTSIEPYVMGGLLGGILGFFLIKLFVLGVHEQEEAFIESSSRPVMKRKQ